MQTTIRNIRAVLFDMDGLMLDTEPVYRRAWTETGANLGFHIPVSFYDRLIGIPNDEGEKILLDFLGGSFPLDVFHTKWRERFAALCAADGIARKPGLDRLLGVLKQQHIKSAIVTSSSHDEMQAIGAGRKIGALVDVVITCDKVQNPKPHPEPYTTAASALGVAPSLTIALEDSNNGMRSAIGAGCKAIMIPDLVGPDTDVRQKAFAVLQSLDELAEMFENARPHIPVS